MFLPVFYYNIFIQNYSYNNVLKLSTPYVEDGNEEEVNTSLHPTVPINVTARLIRLSTVAVGKQ
jgi:hypothetical protein